MHINWSAGLLTCALEYWRLPVEGTAGPIRFWSIASKAKSRQCGPEQCVDPHQHNGKRHMTLLNPLTWRDRKHSQRPIQGGSSCACNLRLNSDISHLICFKYFNINQSINQCLFLTVIKVLSRRSNQKTKEEEVAED